MSAHKADREDGDPEGDFTIPADADLDLPSDTADSESEKAEIDPEARRD